MPRATRSRVTAGQAPPLIAASDPAAIEKAGNAAKRAARAQKSAAPKTTESSAVTGSTAPEPVASDPSTQPPPAVNPDAAKNAPTEPPRALPGGPEAPPKSPTKSKALGGLQPPKQDPETATSSEAPSSLTNTDTLEVAQPNTTTTSQTQPEEGTVITQPATAGGEPTPTATATATATASGKSGPAGVTGQSTGEKRPREDGGGRDRSIPSKKRKGGGATDGDGKSTTATITAATGPCAKLATELLGLRDVFDSVEDADRVVISGVLALQQLPDETVYRAIAAVTEAISELPGQSAFSLVSLASIRLPADSPLRQRIARPGNPALIPHTQDGHTSLFSLQLQRPGHYALHHYDSAGVGHEGALERYGDRVRDELVRLGWRPRGKDFSIETTTVPRAHQTRQSQGWECGMHVIFYAWAIALELQINGTGKPKPAASFLEDGALLINYALLGIASSDVILAFLQCYGLVSHDQVVPVDLAFTRTMPFRKLTTLERRIAHLRVEEELTERRQTDNQVPRLEFLINVTGLTDNDLLTTTGTQVYKMYKMMRSRTPPAQTGSNVPGSNPEVSPETLLAMQRLEERDAPAVQPSTSAHVAKDTGVETTQPTESTGAVESIEPKGPIAAGPPNTLSHEETGTIKEALGEGPTVSEERMRTTLLNAVENSPPIPPNPAASNEAVVTTTLTTTVEMDPLDIEAQQRNPPTSSTQTVDPSNHSSITPEPTGNDDDEDALQPPLSEDDDLFGDADEEAEETNTTTVTLPPPPLLTGLRSPSLALPPPTPRNTAAVEFGGFFLPGLGPQSHHQNQGDVEEEKANERPKMGDGEDGE